MSKKKKSLSVINIASLTGLSSHPYFELNPKMLWFMYDSIHCIFGKDGSVAIYDKV
jgi:hypothetical protein